MPYDLSKSSDGASPLFYGRTSSLPLLNATLKVWTIVVAQVFSRVFKQHEMPTKMMNVLGTHFEHTSVFPFLLFCSVISPFSGEIVSQNDMQYLIYI